MITESITGANLMAKSQPHLTLAATKFSHRNKKEATDNTLLRFRRCKYVDIHKMDLDPPINTYKSGK